MNLQQRIGLLIELSQYISSQNTHWESAKEKAYLSNNWFIPEFIDLAISNIASQYLNEEKLKSWAARYHLPDDRNATKQVGIVMAGNIPLAGFHDFLCGFVSGHRLRIKTSSKDNVLLNHLAEKLIANDMRLRGLISFEEQLKGCDAYIATGSGNTARYFEYYFRKYPSIIRRNRTSVALLTGNETHGELGLLADDVHQYFGLGCRNVTKLYVPAGYDFLPLLDAFRKYSYLSENNKYRNNYDYQLALLILNKQQYMSNDSLLLVENGNFYSPISVLHYEYYTQIDSVITSVTGNDAIQCFVEKSGMGFGQAQSPGLGDYADGVDTMEFLVSL